MVHNQWTLGWKDNSRGKGKAPVCYKRNRTGILLEIEECHSTRFNSRRLQSRCYLWRVQWQLERPQFHVADTHQQPAIVNASQQQASATKWQQQPPTTYQIGTVKRGSVLMLGNTHTYRLPRQTSALTCFHLHRSNWLTAQLNIYL